MSIASVFAGLFGWVARADHDKLRAENARLKNPLRDGEIATVMAQMEENLNAHRYWLAAAVADPTNPKFELVGDAAYQQFHIDRYEGFIACLARAQAEIARLKQ